MLAIDLGEHIFSICFVTVYEIMWLGVNAESLFEQRHIILELACSAAWPYALGIQNVC